jgi:hypothetical protein
VKRPLFFAPSDIGPLDNEDHYIAFRPGYKNGYLCSEPHPVLRTKQEEIFVRRVEQQLQSRRATPLGSEFFRKIGDRLVDIFERRPAFRPEEFDQQPNAHYLPSIYRPGEDRREMIGALRRIRQDREPSEYASYVCQTLFDCELLIAVKEIKEN